MTPNHYRLLLAVQVIAALLYAGLVLAGTIRGDAPTPSLGQAQGALFMLLAGALIGAYGAMLLGLFTFQRWGRSLALACTAISLVIVTITATPAVTGWQALAYFVATTSWGAALALAYVGPVAERFERTITSSTP
ncbi:hypothetical protein FOZ76_08845 [Verticiella sediminum]|uniref:Uncharacterized protein n=1 Tax=Verticiella sediminum TaxID=1247510 RepID=A0A556AU73_9BURK|nr:hypothetical protein [Verticiella sediminum]TSH96494.1 hypothetical protein FOZ76_08845 [Verticiella sediminum]